MKITYELSENELEPKVIHEGFAKNFIFAMTGKFKDNFENLIFLGSNKISNKDYYLVRLKTILSVDQPYMHQIGSHFNTRFTTDQIEVKLIQSKIEDIVFANWIPAYMKSRKYLMLK